MPILDIFVSFEFDKDNDLKNNFFEQAKRNTRHQVRNRSLKEAYPDETWKRKAWDAVGSCNVVVVLIGQDTHNAQGVITEIGIARRLNKPIFQIRPQGRPYKGLTCLDEPISWKWKQINTELDAIASRSR